MGGFEAFGLIAAIVAVLAVVGLNAELNDFGRARRRKRRRR